MLICPNPVCGSTAIAKNGRNTCGSQVYRCKDCGKRFIPESEQKRRGRKAPDDGLTPEQRYRKANAEAVAERQRRRREQKRKAKED